MSQEDDDIFYLLNGVQRTADQPREQSSPLRASRGGDTLSASTLDDSEIEMFVDANGVPTDTFLESLKHDALAASEALNKKLISDSFQREMSQSRDFPPRDFTARKVHYHSRYLDSSSESDSDYNDNSAPHRSRDSFLQYLQNEKRTHAVSEEESNPQATLKQGKTKGKSQKAPKKSPSKQASRENPGHATPIPISSTNFSNPKSKRGYMSSSLDTGRDTKSKKSSAKVQPKKRIPPNRLSQSTSRLSKSVSRSSEGDTVSALCLTKQAEEKNDKLKLRLQGQLNSIRVLETQLAEAQHGIAVRDLELANALRRITQLESREKEKQIRREREEDGAQRNIQKDDGSMYKLKTELIALQARFNDEKSRRTRTEERLRIIKEHCEKQKARVTEVEDKNEELEGVLQQLHEKLRKKKLEAKSTSKDVNVARVKVVEKDSELLNCKNQLLRSERSVKDLRHDNDRLKEELRLLRREASISDDKNRRSALEIEVLRERQNATKLAYRLQNQNQTLSEESSHLICNSTTPSRRNRSYSGSTDNSANNSYSNYTCPYSKRSSSAKIHDRSSKNVSSPSRDAYQCQRDDDSDSVVSRNSSDHSSYDIDHIIAHHENETERVSKKMAENLPPPPPEETSSSKSASHDLSLLSDSSGMGEEFNRLQKMYQRVQGIKQK